MSNGVTSSAIDPVRAALTDIVVWSADATAWQRDALRRLYAQQKLSASDVEELYVLCRQVHGLLEPGEAALTAQPLNASHVPANWNTGGVVALKSIGHAKNVNALADDQTLNFAEDGLTVVYGDNGAGKSGYGRVLKRACRARDQEDILTNAYATSSGKPSARIKYSVAGTVQPEVAWQDGVAASPDLSNISVFDSKCASVHVGGPNDLAYTPVPLQLLQALADLVRDFAGKLKTKKGVVEGQVPSFRKKPASREGTAVHQLILELSATTHATSVASLVEMSDHGTQRLEQVKRDLASDPAKEIRKLNALKERVEKLVKVVEASESVLLPGKADELHQLLVTAKDKATAAPHYQSVNRADDRAGICIPGAPFKAKSVPEMVAKLDNRLDTTTVLHTNGRLDEWADQVKAMSGILRDGWERAAETYVAPVAQRFINKVHPGGLRMLTILTDQDFTVLNEGYGFACTYCHTDSVALNRPVPTPAKLKDEIDRLRNWFDSVRTRQEQKR